MEQEVTHLMPETNRFEDPRCQSSDSTDTNNLPWSETGPPWTILGNCSLPPLCDFPRL